jgi:hypothetical protein
MKEHIHRFDVLSLSLSLQEIGHVPCYKEIISNWIIIMN